MRTNLSKGWGLLAALALGGMLWISGTRAQSAGGVPKASLVTTNWIGCLVVGKADFVDNMARGLHPTAVQQVEIGLRSDGVVVWRNSETR